MLLHASACGDSPADRARQLPEVRPDAGVMPDAPGPDADGSAPDADGTPPALPTRPPAGEGLAWVDPFIGTGGAGFGYAALTPAAQVPNGLVKVGPDTTDRGTHPDISHFSGYNDNDPDVRGYSHIRLVGTGAGDLCLLRFMPLRNRPTNPRRVFSPRDRDAEEASPGYYAGRLPQEDVRVELTAGAFTAIHRYTFEAADGGWIVLDPTANLFDRDVLEASITLTADGFEGRLLFRGGFAGRRNPQEVFFRADVVGGAPAGTWNGEAWTEALEASDGQVTGLWRLPSAGTVEIRLALSLVDTEGARANAAAELTGVSFDDLRARAVAAWQEKLDRVAIRSDDPGVQTRFWTAMYNLWRMPSRLDEADGRYRGLDFGIHDAGATPYYSDLSLWDSFRTLHPLYEWIDPALEIDVLHSLLRMGEHYGSIPRWPALTSETGSMIGAPANQLFAGAALKGLEGIDWNAAFDALLASAQREEGGTRPHMEPYLRMGYMPSDEVNESVSYTLEYAWNDDALARLATLLGRTGDADLLRAQSLSFLRVWDPVREAFWPRLADGTFEARGTMEAGYGRSGPFTEGTAWNWRFYPIWAPDRTVTLFGSPARLGDLLEDSFVLSAYGAEEPLTHFFPDAYHWHGNQPSLMNPFFFHETDRPHRLGWWLRQLQLRAYGTGPDGLPGNDDGGTLSAWFVFSALGFMPVAGTDEYIVASPMVEAAWVDVPGGPTTVILAPGAPEAFTVRTLSRNDAPELRTRIPHADLVGATWRFAMDDRQDP